MWDQLNPAAFNNPKSRIIPTYVGSTRYVPRTYPMHPNHSHVCGINEVSRLAAVRRRESFPRMWDQLCVIVCGVSHPRIIPTYVGSTESRMLLSYRKTNHSHVCGINSLRYGKNVIANESFPRMWDQLISSTGCNSHIRIIPTYVGSTCFVPVPCQYGTNHSHVCGINTSMVDVSAKLCESFPRMWDQLNAPDFTHYHGRIIPTYVGSTSSAERPM